MTRHHDVADSFDELCRRHYDLPVLLNRAEHDQRPELSDVRELLDFGCLALAVPEQRGGLGMGPIDIASVAMAAGRYLIPLHVLSSMLLAAPVVASSTDAALLDDLVSGKVSAATAFSPAADGGLSGGDGWPAWAPSDAELLVTARPGLLAVYPFDESWPSTEALALEPGQGLRQVAAWNIKEPTPLAVMRGELAAQTWQLWQLGWCAQALGCATYILERSVDYAKQRRQFGVPIASFQAVAHLLAEMYVSVTTAESMVSRIAHLLEAGSADAEREAASLAHWLPARARTVCEQAIQVHGGTGFTWELGLHLFYRRVLTVQSLLGGDRVSARRVAAVLRERRKVAAVDVSRVAL